MRADVDAAGPLPAGELPQIDVARRRIEPERVGRAIVIEIAETGWLIARRMRAGIGTAGPLTVGELPDVDTVGAGIVPGKVAGRVAVEIGDPGRQPTRRMRRNVDPCRPMDRRRVHELIELRQYG